MALDRSVSQQDHEAPYAAKVDGTLFLSLQHRIELLLEITDRLAMAADEGRALVSLPDVNILRENTITG